MVLIIPISSSSSRSLNSSALAFSEAERTSHMRVRGIFIAAVKGTAMPENGKEIPPANLPEHHIEVKELSKSPAEEEFSNAAENNVEANAESGAEMEAVESAAEVEAAEGEVDIPLANGELNDSPQKSPPSVEANISSDPVVSGGDNIPDPVLSGEWEEPTGVFRIVRW